MKRHALPILMASAVCCPLPASAASFSCAKASTVQEKLVCSDRELSKLDEELAAEYRKALPGPQEPLVRERQTEWLRERNQCSDAPCVKAAYLLRLNELRGGPISAAPSTSSPNSPLPAHPAAPPLQSAANAPSLHGNAMSEPARHSQQPASFSISSINIGNGVLPAEVATVVRQHVSAHLVGCNGRLFIPDSPPYVIAEPKIALSQSYPLDVADKMNHVEWRGRVAVFGSAVSYFSNAKWTSWVAVDLVRDRGSGLMTPDIHADILAKKINGQWTLEGIERESACPDGAP